MDILISSNLERLLFMLSGNNDIKVSAMMDSLKAKGSYRIDDVMLKKIRETFSGYWTNEEQCALTIHDLFVEQNVLIDPHTAVGVSAMERYQKETGDYTPAVVLSTASPYKFCRDVYFSITGEKKDDDFEAMDALEKLSGVKVPANLAELKDMKVRFTRSIEKEDGLHVIAERMRGLGNAQN
jgi:threonine synthase